MGCMVDQEQTRLRVGGAPSAAAISPLPRVIFLLHRTEGATHGEIAAKLRVTQAVVECAIAHVLVTLVRMREGKPPQPCIYPDVDAAEAGLHEVFRASQPAWRVSNAVNRYNVSPSLRAWGGKTEFDAWLWDQVIAQ